MLDRRKRVVVVGTKVVHKGLSLRIAGDGNSKVSVARQSRFGANGDRQSSHQSKRGSTTIEGCNNVAERLFKIRHGHQEPLRVDRQNRREVRPVARATSRP